MYFDLDGAKRLEKGENDRYYEVPANYLQKAKEGPSAKLDSHLVRSEAQEIFFLMHS